jgi:hypothetical protein
MKSAAPVNKTAKILSWIVAGILVALPFHAFLTTWVGSHTGHFDLIHIWKEIVIAMMLPLLVWQAWREQTIRKWLLSSWVVRLIAVYALLHFILGIWAYSHHQVNRTALIYGLIINLRFVYFFLVCAVVAASSNFLKNNWVKILIIPGAVVIFIGLLQEFLLPSDFLKHFGYGATTIPAYQTVDANVDYTRLQSTLRGANPLGAYLILVIPALLHKLRRKVYLWTIGLTAGLIVLFYTYSRSAIVGLALALASFGWLLMKRPTRKWIITGLLSLLIICGLYLGFRSSQTIQDVFLHTSTSSSSAASSNQIRNDALRNASRDVIDQPLGRGPGTAGPASFRNNHPARIAEDYYLQIGQEVGLIGMILFIAITILVARQLWFNRQDNLARILLASLIGISFVNLVSHAWTDDTLSLLWWGLAGIALAPGILKARKKNGQTRLQKT